MWTDPLGALACFGRLQAAAGRPPARLLLITDNSAARDCAARNGVHTTDGEAIHLGTQDDYCRSDVDKLMLDWWLMSRARRAASLDMSTLLETARFRDGDWPLTAFQAGCNHSAAFVNECVIELPVHANGTNSTAAAETTGGRSVAR